MQAYEGMPGGPRYHTETTLCCEKCGRPFGLDVEGVKLDGTRLLVGSQILKLTLRERDMVHLLLKHFGQVVHRQSILTQVWGEDYCDKSIDVYVCKLRKKLAPLGLIIRNSWAIGYAMDFAAPSVASVNN